MWTRLLLTSALLLPTAVAHAQPADEGQAQRVKKAHELVTEKLAKLGAEGGQVLRLDAPELARLFPDQLFFTARFRQFPVARVLPAGLGAANVFVVDKQDIVHRLNDSRSWARWWQTVAVPVKTEALAKEAMSAWLAVSPEFVQDGLFQFEILRQGTMADKLATGEYRVRGRAIVAAGGNGDIKATLFFDLQGKLTSVEEMPKVRPGPRPICQATKLLDADAIVRRMAEQDLLIMGLAAGDYLHEQRAVARPELQQAIDRLWQRIVANGW